MSDSDTIKAKGYFSKYRQRNGLSKKSEKELAELPYGDLVRALAKLCNINVFLTIKSNAEIPAKVKIPLKQLAEGALIPIHNGKNDTDKEPRLGNDTKDYLTLLDGYYEESKDVSNIALFRYYHLPINSDFELLPLSIRDLWDEFEWVAGNYVSDICKQFKNQQAINKTYIFDNAQKIDELVTGNKLVYQISKKFTKLDYVEFIGDVDHLNVDFFPDYLQNFCNKNDIFLYERATMMDRTYMEYDAFHSILLLVQSYLLHDFLAFWEKSISNSLYGVSYDGTVETIIM